MNKFLQKVAKIFLGLSMAAGVGVAVYAGRKDASPAQAASVTASVNMSSFGWGSTTQNAKGESNAAAIDSNVKFYTTGGSNNGKYYSDWRLYNSGSGNVIVKAYNNCKLTSITYTFTNSNSGCLGNKNGSNVTSLVTSGTAISLSNVESVEYKVGNTNGNTNGQIRITAISVTYTTGGSESVAVTGVSLDKESASVVVGSTVTLTPTVSPNNATDKSVTWKSYSDSSCTVESASVASVSNGVVTGVSAGTAYIQVKTTDGNFTAKCTVTVTAPVLTEFEKITAVGDLEAGKKYVIGNGAGTIFMSSTQNSNNRGQTSATASNNKVTETSSMEVVELGGNANDGWTLSATKTEGYLTAVSGNNYLRTNSSSFTWSVSFSSGNAEISHVYSESQTRIIRYNSGNSIFSCYTSGQGVITLWKEVSTDPSISFVSPTTTVAVGSTVTNTATTKNCGDSPTITYSVTASNPSGCATVGASTGTVTGVSAGTATIQASVTVNQTAYTATYSITVEQPTLINSVTITGAPASEVTTATIGDTINLSASVDKVGDGTVTLTWTSSDTTVATVVGSNTTAVVTYLGNGSTTITAQADYPASAQGSNSGTASISISTLKGTSTKHFTVAEARTYIDTLGSGSSPVTCYVDGIISQVDSYDSNHKSITYWISDDGSTTDQLECYSGKGLNGADFAAVTDVETSAEVSVCGTLKKYNSVYEFNYNNELVSYEAPATLSSIAVKTAPNKTAYKSGETFDPTGLVITATYSNSDTEDIAYADQSGSFSFSPSTITAAGDVTITYREKTCTQAVTLVTIVNVTGVSSHPDEVYQNDPIDPSDVVLNVTYSDSSVGTVVATSVSCDTSAIAAGVEATATYSGASSTKTATFYINVVKKPVWDYVDDVIDNAKTASNLGNTGTTAWGSDFEIDFASGSKYTVHSMGTKDTSNALQFNTNGYLFATRSGGFAYSISIKGASDKKINIFASNSAYSEAPSGDYLTQLTLQGTSTATTYDFESNYTFIAIRGASSGTSILEVTITWKVEGAEYPLTENPTLSPSGSATVSVGKNLPITVISAVSGENESDERLIISSDDTSKVTVSGSGKNFLVHGVAITSTPVNVTIGGIKGVYKTTIAISVEEGSKTYEDKVLTQSSLGISSYDTDTSHDYTDDDVNYVCYNVMNSNGMQFKAGSGYISNKEELYDKGDSADIKAVTLFLHDGQSGTPAVYEGNEADPGTSVDATVTTGNVITYQFSSGMTYFKVKSSTGTLQIEKIVVELIDEAHSELEEARLAALEILTDLSGSCGDGGSGFVSQSDWNDLNQALEDMNMSENAKYYLKTAPRMLLDNLSQGGADIENAMAHYDACVQKFGYTPFSDITNAQASPRVSPLVNIIGENTNTVAIIVIISMVSVTAIGGYFFLRKRKENI